MRTLRHILVGPVVLALLVSLGGVGVAQEEAAESTATTGTLMLTEPGADPEVHVHTWTAEDPRLTGTATYTGTWHLYDPPSEECDQPEGEGEAMYEIVTEGGSWVCAGVNAPIPGPEGATNVHVLALTGTGGYEGLHAYIMIDWGTDPFTFSALITPNHAPIDAVMQG